jgi:signal transduction histidine kinase
MTRRIATAILLTVWAILVAGGCVAYWVTRSVLLADMDQSLVANARSLPQVAGGRAGAMPPTAGPEDRYVIQNAIGQRVGRPAGGVRPDAGEPAPPYTAAFATLAGGQRVRTVSVRLTAGHGAGRSTGAPATAGEPVVVVYSRPTDQLDRLLRRLAAVLALCGLAAGAGAAAVAVGVARAALRPLSAAADVVGVIDEKNLDRRIDEHSLPPELRPVAARLNAMLERLANAFAQRRQFLADASHELRTPVAALVTTLEVALRRKRDAAELTRTLENCLSDARYLRRLVTTLLDLARGDAAAGPAAEAFDAAGVLDQCVSVAEALARSRDVRIIRAYAAPLRLVSDPDLLRGVVTNLLANAVEHNRPGGVVELAAGISGGALRFSVRDTGPGIAPEHLPHLFQPFYRAESSRRRGSDPHLGLGLYIVESHLRALGGTCRVESEPGQGTVFRVEIPGGGTPHSAAETPYAAGGGAAGGGFGPPALQAGGLPLAGTNIPAPSTVSQGEGSGR